MNSSELVEVNKNINYVYSIDSLVYLYDFYIFISLLFMIKKQLLGWNMVYLMSRKDDTKKIYNPSHLI